MGAALNLILAFVNDLPAGQHAHACLGGLGGLQGQAQVKALALGQMVGDFNLAEQHFCARGNDEGHNHDLDARGSGQAGGGLGIAGGSRSIRKDDHAAGGIGWVKRQRQLDGLGQVGLVCAGDRAHSGQRSHIGHAAFHQGLAAKGDDGGLVVWPHGG